MCDIVAQKKCEPYATGSLCVLHHVYACCNSCEISVLESALHTQAGKECMSSYGQARHAREVPRGSNCTEPGRISLRSWPKRALHSPQEALAKFPEPC